MVPGNHEDGVLKIRSLRVSFKEFRQGIVEKQDGAHIVVVMPVKLLVSVFVKALAQFVEVFGPERHVSVCREISKIHEESVRGTLQEVLQHFTETEPRGEFVIVVRGLD